MSQESMGPLLLWLCNPFNMCMPGEVIADVHSEVLSTIHYFECVPMELVLKCLFWLIGTTWHFFGRNCICHKLLPFLSSCLFVVSWLHDKHVNKIVIDKGRRSLSGQQLHKPLKRLLFSSAEMFKKPLWQTVWTQIRLLLSEQSDLGPPCLLLYLICQ